MINIENFIEHDITCEDNSKVIIEEIYSDSYSNLQFYNSGWIPNDITFKGSIKDNDSSLSGELNIKSSNISKLDIEMGDFELVKPLLEINFEGKLKMPGKKEVSLKIKISNTDTVVTITGQYIAKNIILEIDSSFDIETGDGSLKIITDTGLIAEVKVIEGDIDLEESSLTRDGKTVGTFEYRSEVPIIKYSDGSFESLP